MTRFTRSLVQMSGIIAVFAIGIAGASGQTFGPVNADRVVVAEPGNGVSVTTTSESDGVFVSDTAPTLAGGLLVTAGGPDGILIFDEADAYGHVVVGSAPEENPVLVATDFGQVLDLSTFIDTPSVVNLDSQDTVLMFLPQQDQVHIFDSLGTYLDTVATNGDSLPSALSASVPFGPPGADAVILNDGGVYTLDSVASEITVLGNTILNVVDGGYADLITAEDSSIVNVDGGAVVSLIAMDTAAANVSEGVVYGLGSTDSAWANVSGGFVAVGAAGDTSDFFVTGGDIEFLSGELTSSLVINSGVVDILELADLSTGTVNGGTVADAIIGDYSTLSVTGESMRPDFIHANDSAVWRILTNDWRPRERDGKTDRVWNRDARRRYSSGSRLRSPILSPSTGEPQDVFGRNARFRSGRTRSGY